MDSLPATEIIQRQRCWAQNWLDRATLLVWKRFEIHEGKTEGLFKGHINHRI